MIKGTKKKILLLSTGDVNGAYELIYRIACFLNEEGHQVAMAVKIKTQKDSFVYQIPDNIKIFDIFLQKVKTKIYSKRKIKTDPKYIFLEENESKKYFDVNTILKIIPFTPELVISGMTNGFLVTRDLAEIKRLTNANIYSVTVDMYPLTGGCHFAWDCKGYEKDCRNCPAIIDKKDKDWAHKNFLIKKENIDKGNMKILAASGWTLLQSRNAALYRNQKSIENINSCIDTKLFNAKNRNIAKQIFSIDSVHKLIFCGAQHLNDPRKGFSYFLESLNLLYNNLDQEIQENIRILVIGRDTHTEIIDRIPFKTHVIEYIKDYRLLTLIYQASDIFVCTSIEDSGPMMVSEALACGTPVVGFDMGVVSNMVINGFNGYKALLKNSKDLSDGLKEILMLPEVEFNTYSKNAIEQVEKYSSRNAVLGVINNF